uniref:DNA2/NAM7 helicase helicase domain-containing protein n=1 Tax=Panagrolaimus superbus TaxID=310955 RepID=A0A914Z1P6_9BILA
MVESPAFFEAYQHVMTALQTLPQTVPIPFSKYLVNAVTKTKVPKYLSTNSINFEVLLKKPLPDDIRLRNYLNAHNFFHYLGPQHFGMDQSQFIALINTLQSDLAIIQGPPGTGKTYMGLRIAKLLLSNDHLWRSGNDQRPMLVVCYTNHALDQFLEGISKFLKDGIVRVGSWK